MANTDPKVMAMVEAELEKNPEVTVDELFAKAKKGNRAIARLSKRQFHARYPLQVKRRKGGAKKSTKAKTATKAAPKSKARRRPAAKKARTKAVSRVRKVVRRARTAPSAPQKGADRDAVRAVFLSFAADLSAAEARKDVVRVVADVDRYVDAAIKAAR